MNPVRQNTIIDVLKDILASLEMQKIALVWHVNKFGSHWLENYLKQMKCPLEHFMRPNTYMNKFIFIASRQPDLC
jgi:hypothetical protein